MAAAKGLVVTNVGTLSPPLGTEASPTFVGDKP